MTGYAVALPGDTGTLAYLTRDPALMPLVLITRLATLAEAVAELRRAQQHATHRRLIARLLWRQTG